MKTAFWVIGKTAFPYLNEGMAIYEKRLKHYLSYEMQLLPDIKNAGKMKAAQLKEKEGELVLKKLTKDDVLVLLDERGKMYSSVEFAGFIDNKLQYMNKRIVFLVGGAFGFSEAVYQRANYKMSLSKMTFSHQMIRLFFMEQLYRAMTIIKGEKYHNE